MSPLIGGTHPGEDVYPGFAEYPEDDGIVFSGRPVVSAAAELLYAALKKSSYLVNEDVDQQTGWCTLLLCDAVTTPGMEPWFDLSRDGDDGTPGWSAIVDLMRAPDAVLPWLGQFVGVTAPTGNTADQNRDLILNRPRTKRGRPLALISAVQQTLTGSQHVSIAERDTSPYHATISVFTSECPDSDVTAAAIAANKPGMLIVDLAVNDGPTYADIEAAIGGSPTYGERIAMFPTYGDVAAFV